MVTLNLLHVFKLLKFISIYNHGNLLNVVIYDTIYPNNYLLFVKQCSNMVL